MSEGVADSDSAHRCASPEPSAVVSEELVVAEDVELPEEFVAASEPDPASSSASGRVTVSFDSLLPDGKRLRVS